jgi:hypothetical protein
MKCNKTLLVLAAAGALTAATAGSALALENEFHGNFTSFYDLSNFSGDPNTINGDILRNAPTQNYFVERVRLGYTAKVSDQVKLVTKFELDYNYLGNSSYVNARGGGGALGADTVNIETKNLYLDLNFPALSTKIGMMPYNDSFKGVFFDADMAGILFSKDIANLNVSTGFFRFSDSGAVQLGRNTYDMIVLDGKYSVTKDTKVGAAYYYIADNRTGTPTFDGLVGGDANIHTVGLNAETAIGPVTLSGFAMAQLGDRNDNQKAEGLAANLGAKLALMGGTLRAEGLFVAGGKHAFYNPFTGNGGSEGGGFYDAEMIMLNRDKNATTIDNAIVYDANNSNQGVIMGSIGYDHPCTEKITSSVNAGFAAVAKRNAVRAPNAKSDYLGTELNVESNYKLTPNVTIGVRGGYVFLGDYFKGFDSGRNPDNPYDMKIIARLAF